MRFAPQILGALFLVLVGCSRPAEEGAVVEPRLTGSTGFPLLVLDGTDDTPIAGARVTWCRLDPLYERGWFTGVAGASPAELEERCAASGKSGVTDAEGRVFVSCESHERVMVTASSGELWGQDDHWGTSWFVAEQKLKLYPDGDLTVLVRESDGSPARDVPVSLRETHRWPRSRDDSWGETVTALVSARTGSDGVATIRHARHEYERHLRTFPRHEGHEFRWSVNPDVCSTERGGAGVEVEPWPEDSFGITLPPTGRVRFLVREPDARPVATTRGIVLTTEQAAAGGRPWAELGRVDPSEAAWRSSADGSVSFDRVGLGLDLVAFATRNDASVTRWVRLVGPREPGELITAEIVLGVDTATFRARAVRESGQPLVRQRLFVELHSGPSSERTRFSNVRPEEPMIVSGGFVDTDAEGGFAVDFDSGIPWGGRGLVTVTHALGDPQSLSARFDLTEEWQEGVHDLGDVILPPAPVLIAGTVVDREERPLEGATVLVSEIKSTPWSHRAVTDAEGRFVVRCASPDHEIDLVISKPGFEMGSPSLAANREDHRVVLRPKEPDPPPPVDGADGESEDLDELDQDQ